MGFVVWSRIGSFIWMKRVQVCCWLVSSTKTGARRFLTGMRQSHSIMHHLINNLYLLINKTYNNKLVRWRGGKGNHHLGCNSRSHVRRSLITTMRRLLGCQRACGTVVTIGAPPLKKEPSPSEHCSCCTTLTPLGSWMPWASHKTPGLGLCWWPSQSWPGCQCHWLCSEVDLLATIWSQNAKKQEKRGKLGLTRNCLWTGILIPL